MRLIRLKLQPATAKAARILSKRHRLRDPAFVEDLCALILTKGTLPSLDNIRSKLPRYAEVFKVTEVFARTVLFKRHQILKGLQQSAVFGYYVTKRADDPVEQRADKLLTFYWDLEARVQEVQCKTCRFFTNCQFGQKYASRVNDIRHVADMDMASLIHPDCPEWPELDRLSSLGRGITKAPEILAALQVDADMNPYTSNRASQYVEDELNWRKIGTPGAAEDAELGDEELLDRDQYENIIRPDGSSGCSKEDGGAGGMSFQVTPDEMIRTMAAANLAVYQLGMVLSGELARAGKVRLSDVSGVGSDKKSRRMRTQKDIPNLESAQNGLPAEVYEARLERKLLRVEDPRNKVAAPQAIAVLEDWSGSMSDMQCTVNGQAFNRSALARALSLAIAKRLASEKGAMIYAGFATSVSEIMRCYDQESLDVFGLSNRGLGNVGGGTSIANALNVMLDVIEEDARAGRITPREILLISDGIDGTMRQPKSYDHFAARLAKAKVDLDYIFLSDNKHGIPLEAHPKDTLSRLAKRMFVCPRGDLQMENLIAVLK